MIYLDNASTTQVSPDLKQLIDKYLYDSYGNASSIYGFGIESDKAISVARKQIAASFSTTQENVIFTSGGSEANTLAIIGLANHLQSLHLNHIITTKYEHHSVLNAMKEMERRGFEITYLDVPNGLVQYNDFVAAVREDTGFVSIMYVNNELGTKNDIKPIYEFCKSREIIFHSDCVQAVGTEDIELGKTADMVSISGHKIHAPKGIGCLCTLYKDFLSNIIFGGQQEFGIRPGTESVSDIAAIGEAIQTLTKNKERFVTHIDTVSLAFGDRLLQLSNELGFKFECNVSTPFRSTKILSIRFENIDAETLVIMLGTRGVCVSAGSACNSRSTEPSHVLKAIGLTDEEARSTIRISFSEYTKLDEAYEAAEIIAECVNTLISMKE